MQDTALSEVSTATLMERILYEVKRVVVGQDRFLERVLVAMLAQGHLLVEGVPGLAKTLTVKTLARTVRGSFKRIQFTPDLVPSDLIGTRIYNQKSGEFGTSLGPVFANLLLADEINRAPAKVQSALLEVMQEHQVTIAGETHRVPDPFVVMATQNPIETEGTYPLPEAQVDRFMMKVLVDYPTEEEEFVIAAARHRHRGGRQRGGRHLPARGLAARMPRRLLRPGADAIRGEAGRRHAQARQVRPGRTVAKYLTYGASPRATIGMIEGAKALAMLRGRRYVLPEDMVDLVPDVLRHRLVLSYEALADNLTRRRRRPAHPEEAARRPTSRWRTPRSLLSSDDGCSARDQPPGVPLPRARVRARRTSCCRRLEWTVIRKPGRPAARRLPHACGAAPASTWPTCANTRPTTTCATSTGTSPRGCSSPMCGSSSKTATSTPGSCWTCRAASISAAPTSPSSRCRPASWPRLRA